VEFPADAAGLFIINVMCVSVCLSMQIPQMRCPPAFRRLVMKRRRVLMAAWKEGRKDAISW